MTPSKLDLIKILPKTDLHCHFDGSIRIKTLIELAQKNGVMLPSYDEYSLMTHFSYGRVRKNLLEYLKGFSPIVACLQDYQDIERAFYEVCLDAYKENVRYLELRYCPYSHCQKGLEPSEVIDACYKAIVKAEKDLNITVKQILCGLKNNSAQSYEIAKLAVKYQNKNIVAFDLAGPEIDHPIKDHIEALQLIKKNRLAITIHAGENTGADYIAQAIYQGSAQRIGHGTSLLSDKELTQYVKEHNIVIESCPTSNLHTGSISDIKHHPIKKMLENDIYVSVNTDNRLCSDTNMTKEILLLITSLNLSMKQIKKLFINGFKGAFIKDKERDIMIIEFENIWAHNTK